MYKFIIAEDDSRVRLLLSRLLKKNFECEIKEAENGLDALSLAQNEPPDILFLDVEMPVMNGIDTLSALRSDPKNSQTLVIILSAANEKATVGRLISLGISEFILKPLQFDSSVERISKVLEKKYMFVKRIAEETAINSQGKIKILLIEKDSHFRSLFVEIFDQTFEIRTADSGVSGLKQFLEFQAEVVLIGEDLTSLNEKLLAYKIKELAEKVKPKLYFLTSHHSSPPNHLFAGLLTKQLDKKLFYSNFMREVFGTSNEFEKINKILKDEFGSEFSSALKQTYSIMTGEEISEFEEETPADNLMYAAALFFNTEKSIEIKLNLISSKQFFIDTAEKITGEKNNFETTGKAVLNELLMTLAGRLKTFFESRGISLNINEEVHFGDKYIQDDSTILITSYKENNGGKFISAISVNKIEATPDENGGKPV